MVCKVDGNLLFDSRDWSMYSSILNSFIFIPFTMDGKMYETNDLHLADKNHVDALKFPEVTFLEQEQRGTTIDNLGICIATQDLKAYQL